MLFKPTKWWSCETIRKPLFAQVMPASGILKPLKVLIYARTKELNFAQHWVSWVGCSARRLWRDDRKCAFSRAHVWVWTADSSTSFNSTRLSGGRRRSPLIQDEDSPKTVHFFPFSLMISALYQSLLATDLGWLIGQQLKHYHGSQNGSSLFKASISS